MAADRGTVVFDLDGTLADTAGDLIAAANATFADRGRLIAGHAWVTAIEIVLGALGRMTELDVALVARLVALAPERAALELRRVPGSTACVSAARSSSIVRACTPCSPQARAMPA